MAPGPGNLDGALAGAYNQAQYSIFKFDFCYENVNNGRTVYMEASVVGANY